MSDPKHTKVTTYKTLDDGSYVKQIKAYHEHLASIREERVESLKTTHATFLADIMKCLEVINSGNTKELTLTIKANDFKNPTMIIKSYITYKEEFKKR